jgi:hypothetical protein
MNLTHAMRVNIDRHRHSGIDACWEAVCNADAGDAATNDVQHPLANVGEIAQQEGGEVNAGVGERIEVQSLTVVTRQQER